MTKHRTVRLAIALALLPFAGGCVRTVASVVTFPVKAASQGVDWATTSQDEADRNYGRKMRKREAAEGKRLRKEQERARREARARGQAYQPYR